MDVPVESLRLLESAVARSRRKEVIRLPPAFFLSQSGVTPPLATLATGGQGGQVRLRLYLCLVLFATKHPFTQSQRSNLAYAQLIGEEGVSGPRRIREALQWLEVNKFIRRSQTPAGASIEMLYPDGSGSEWPARFTGRFISVPLELWSNGWIVRLSARALAVYFFILELTAGRDDVDGNWMARYRKTQYGLSDDTWTRALKELEALGLVSAKRERYGDEWTEIRVRKRYLPIPNAMNTNPDWSWQFPAKTSGASSLT